MPGERELARVFKPFPSEILSVSALARSVRDLLEHRYPVLWVAGEISNFILAKSGHAYFVLKDGQAQVRCVMFRNRHQNLDWQLRDGMQVEAQALVTLYEPRGDFQLNVETMRRAGLGALFEAFLRLREKLEKEGLFDSGRKRALPQFPRTIGVITSLEAAALRDVLTTLRRRNASIPVVVYPAPVQGEGAAQKIAEAFDVAARRAECDVLLLVRGGGGIEDLRAFNEEAVARAIRACTIPVVTGIGHETDFTIADLAADRRAPTPTAAAELASPDRQALLGAVGEFVERLGLSFQRKTEARMQLVDHLVRRMVYPGAKLRMQDEMLSHLKLRLRQAATREILEQNWRLADLAQRIRARLPKIGELSARPEQLLARLRNTVRASLDRAASDCLRLGASLSHLDPASVLKRGYSVVRDEAGRIVRRGSDLVPGDALDIAFAEGGAEARVERSR
jgi:exodeoxyribonuclease VII large subunit